MQPGGLAVVFETAGDSMKSGMNTVVIGNAVVNILL